MEARDDGQPEGERESHAGGGQVVSLEPQDAAAKKLPSPYTPAEEGGSDEQSADMPIESTTPDYHATPKRNQAGAGDSMGDAPAASAFDVHLLPPATPPGHNHHHVDLHHEQPAADIMGLHIISDSTYIKIFLSYIQVSRINRCACISLSPPEWCARSTPTDASSTSPLAFNLPSKTNRCWP